ncbi:MAG: tRNA dimethylallyltransferase, partial [Glaciecola sp.]
MSTFDQSSLFDVEPLAPEPEPAAAPEPEPAAAPEPAAGEAAADAVSSAPVLVLVGPTASGKSTAAMQVASARGDVEIVAMDAFTVYRGMDLGTAKPSAEDRAMVPHHLIDILDPSEVVNVAWFRDRAREAIADIHGRGKVPLLVGGSGLYFRAVVDPLDFPPTDVDERDRIEERWREDVPGAYAHLTEVDPA